MLILVITAIVVVAVVLAVVFGAYLWRLVRRDRTKQSAHRDVDREFRKIARRIGRLDSDGDQEG